MLSVEHPAEASLKWRTEFFPVPLTPLTLTGSQLCYVVHRENTQVRKISVIFNF